MLRSIKNTFLIVILFSAGTVGCKKYLDAKPDQKLVIPSTITDLQSLLDNYRVINQSNPSGVAEMSADNYYVTSVDYKALKLEIQRRIYLWEKDNLFATGNDNDWAKAYNKINYANIVLNEINNIQQTPGGQENWNTLKGHALFTRAFSFLHAAFLWTLAYDKQTADTDLGLPLRLDPDFNAISVRSTVQQTYDQIISDLKEAAGLLPVIPLHVVRPSKAAALTLLARTYLSMREYDSAGKYADRSLQLKNDLLDYNELPNPAAAFPFSRFNKEVSFDTYDRPPAILSMSVAKIDSVLVQLYEPGDIRKTAFFKNNNNGTFGFKGSYIGNNNLFAGITVSETYLMRAECLARTGNLSAAMDDLNTLLSKRYLTGTFTPLTAIDAADALTKILIERRKELLMRGVRWMDIKRLNKEGANITLKRIIDGQEYLLPSNDLRYALPIPEDVINISGMQQNKR